MPGQPPLGTKNSLNSQIKSYPYDANPNMKDNKPEKDPFGFRISLIALRNYSLKKAIKLKVIIYEEYYHENDKGMKYEYGTIYHD